MAAAPKGNKYAQKNPLGRQDAYMMVRCRTEDKLRWHRAAILRAKRDENMKARLTSWVHDTLNAEAKFEEDHAEAIRDRDAITE